MQNRTRIFEIVSVVITVGYILSVGIGNVLGINEITSNTLPIGVGVFLVVLVCFTFAQENTIDQCIDDLKKG